jgi:hypothetical protein
VPEGETGTELTWMTSSWKSVGGWELIALSDRTAGIGGLIWGIGLLFGLVCLGARGGGGNNWSAGPAMMSLRFALLVNGVPGNN